jgi:hypothetical protein
MRRAFCISPTNLLGRLINGHNLYLICLKIDKISGSKVLGPGSKVKRSVSGLIVPRLTEPNLVKVPRTRGILNRKRSSIVTPLLPRRGPFRIGACFGRRFVEIRISQILSTASFAWHRPCFTR